MTYRINMDLCLRCGACESECPFGAVRRRAEGFAIDSKRCKGCASCASICPGEAITKQLSEITKG